jgi:hypothetical protein
MLQTSSLLAAILFTMLEGAKRRCHDPGAWNGWVDSMALGSFVDVILRIVPWSSGAFEKAGADGRMVGNEWTIRLLPQWSCCDSDFRGGSSRG